MKRKNSHDPLEGYFESLFQKQKTKFSTLTPVCYSNPMNKKFAHILMLIKNSIRKMLVKEIDMKNVLTSVTIIPYRIKERFISFFYLRIMKTTHPEIRKFHSAHNLKT